MEALLRWQHPELGILAPHDFIPLAEKTGLIVPIGEWVLRTACRQNRAWQDAGFPPIQMGINLSVRQLQSPNFIDIVRDILQETGLAPQWLSLEIKETIFIQNVDFIRSVLWELQKLGVRICMDDFGTGYSSLSYLKRFPFHTLKIDHTFIQELEANSPDLAIISAVISLASYLNISVVAEGIEREEQLQLLQGIQCHQMQGYLFSMPVAAGEATKLLAQPDNLL